MKMSHPKPDNDPHKTPKDYQDPTGNKTPIGHTPNSGYDEKQPTQPKK